MAIRVIAFNISESFCLSKSLLYKVCQDRQELFSDMCLKNNEKKDVVFTQHLEDFTFHLGDICWR